MREKLGKFAKVLRIELEDLEEDLKLLADLYNQREERKEITGYVFLENISLVKSEISGIEQIIRSLDDIVIDSFSSLDEFVEHVDDRFRQKTQDMGFPEAVYALVKRKLLKVSSYIHGSEE